ncbi:mRNA export factor elf1 [Rhodotorula toruloides ATCC 204091]|uniref:mRNA export factor elf1 n=1 Tax=Rhodotorula toruloides TaxID=5286 RepID=A0A0K3CNH5_RHOTO|nr:mRNA export factor elf1 [Rhodotorula toruloides ATCC 204091]PRQ71505.1 mRNA export factor elf1 [Rhodotorula toruloides]
MRRRRCDDATARVRRLVVCISHSQEFVGALCGEIWTVEAGRLSMKGKAAVDDGAFDSNPTSARDTPIGTPGVATPASVETVVGSGDEARVAATVEGAGEELKFKAAKGRKKLTRKQLKEHEENPIHAQQKLRIPSKAKRSGTSTPTIAGMRT